MSTKPGFLHSTSDAKKRKRGYITGLIVHISPPHKSLQQNSLVLSGYIALVGSDVQLISVNLSRFMDLTPATDNT